MAARKPSSASAASVASDRADDGRGVVGGQRPGQGEQPEPGIVARGGRDHPGPGAEGPGRTPTWTAVRSLGPDAGRRRRPAATGTAIAAAARAPAREARRSRTPAASTEHTAGSGTRSRSRQPPSSRRSATAASAGLARAAGHSSATRPSAWAAPSSWARKAGRAPVPRSAERSPHTTRRRPAARGEGGRHGPGQRLLVAGQLAARSPASASVAGDGDPQHRRRRARPPPAAPARPTAGPDGDGQHADPTTPRRSAGRAPGRPRRRRRARAPAVAAHRAGQRVDLRAAGR